VLSLQAALSALSAAHTLIFAWWVPLAMMFPTSLPLQRRYCATKSYFRMSLHG